MSDSRDHKCPRCGAPLPTVTVQKPVPYPTSITFDPEPPKVIGEDAKHILHRYETVEEPGECFRCTGSY